MLATYVQDYILPYFESRPVTDSGECVAPSDLAAHRRSHQFQGPHCLCALIDEDPSSHCEAAMIMLTQGAHAGEDVACCASSKCGYIGKLSSTV